MLDWIGGQFQQFINGLGDVLLSEGVRDFVVQRPEGAIIMLSLLVVPLLDGLGLLPRLPGLVIGNLRRARRDVETRQSLLRLRQDSGSRFAVVLAPIERDPDDELKLLIDHALSENVDEFIFNRSIEVQRPELQLEGPEAALGAREIADSADADLLIWGKGGRGRGLWRIYFLTKRARENKEPVQEIRLIPPDENIEARRLAAGVAYIFARLALPCAEEPDRYLPEKLAPVLDALDRLLADPPNGLGEGFERLLREDAARIALSLGERNDDADALRRASRLRVRLLAEINREEDPLGWALARSALGRVHLAIGARESDVRRLDAAIEAFGEAAEILRDEGYDAQRAETFLQLGHAHRERARLDDESVHLTRAAKAFRKALKISPDLEPRFADTARRGLASALHGLAELSGDEGALEQAIDVYRQAASDRARQIDPAGWSQAQHDLGLALAALGARTQDHSKLDEAVAAFRAALQERTREKTPLAWADTMNQLGHAFFNIGKNDPKAEAIEAAIWAYEEALSERTREQSPYEWAQTQNNLGNAYHAIGERDADEKALKKAVLCYQHALEELPREAHPYEWAGTQNNLGNALHVLGERSNRGVEALEMALKAHRAALTVRTKERARVDWAATRNNMGLVLTTLGARLRDPGRLQDAMDAYRDALGVFRLAGAVRYAVMAERNLERARELLHDSQDAAAE